MRTYICIFLLLLFNLLHSSCSRKNPSNTSKTYNIHKNFISNDFVIPQEVPQKNPIYPWEKQHTLLPSFTKYSFRCAGTNLEEEIPDYKKCLGSLQHGLPLYKGKEYIYPRLIELLNFLQKENKEKISIIKGHLCPKVFSLLENKEQNNKYLLGAIVKISSQINWEQKLPFLIKKFYEKKKEDNSLNKINHIDYPLIFINNEFKFIIYKPLTTNIMEIEVLYDKEKGATVNFTVDDAQNYLHY